MREKLFRPAPFLFSWEYLGGQLDVVKYERM